LGSAIVQQLLIKLLGYSLLIELQVSM